MVSRIVVSKLVSYDADYIGEKDEIFFDGSNLKISDGVNPGGNPLTSNNMVSGISGNYNISDFDSSEMFIGVDTTTETSVINLDNNNTEYNDGQKIIVKDVSGNSSANIITVQSNTYNIDGSSTITIGIDYGSITLIFNNNTWSII